MSGNVEKLNKLKYFIECESETFTAEVLQKQNLMQADIAWKKNDYLTFVKLIDKMIDDQLPDSYKFKYKIAKRRSG